MGIVARGPKNAPDSSIPWYGPEWIALDVDGPDPRVAPGLPARPGSIAYWPVTWEQPRIFRKDAAADTGWVELPYGAHTVETITAEETDTLVLTIDGTRKLFIEGKVRNRVDDFSDCYGYVPDTDPANGDVYMTNGFIDAGIGVGEVTDGTAWQWGEYGPYYGPGPAGEMGWGPYSRACGLYFGRCGGQGDMSFRATLDLRPGRVRWMESRAAANGDTNLFRPQFFAGFHNSHVKLGDSAIVTTLTLAFPFSVGDTVEWWQE